MCYEWLHTEVWILYSSTKDWQTPDATTGIRERTVRKIGEESDKRESLTSNSVPSLRLKKYELLK